MTEGFPDTATQRCKILSAVCQLHCWYSLIPASQVAEGPSKTACFTPFYKDIWQFGIITAPASCFDLES